MISGLVICTIGQAEDGPRWVAGPLKAISFAKVVLECRRVGSSQISII